MKIKNESIYLDADGVSWRLDGANIKRHLHCNLDGQVPVCGATNWAYHLLVVPLRS